MHIRHARAATITSARTRISQTAPVVDTREDPPDLVRLTKRALVYALECCRYPWMVDLPSVKVWLAPSVVDYPSVCERDSPRVSLALR